MSTLRPARRPTRLALLGALIGLATACGPVPVDVKAGGEAKTSTAKPKAKGTATPKPAGTLKPTPSPTPAGTPTPAATASPTPSASPTPAATATPALSASPTAAPAASPSASATPAGIAIEGSPAVGTKLTADVMTQHAAFFALYKSTYKVGHKWTYDLTIQGLPLGGGTQVFTREVLSLSQTAATVRSQVEGQGQGSTNEESLSGDPSNYSKGDTTFLGVEDVTVPAGTFAQALKVAIKVANPAGGGDTDATAWIQKGGNGMVKNQSTSPSPLGGGTLTVITALKTFVPGP